MSEPISSKGGNAVEWARPVLLRQSRESAGLHIAALAAALKVPVRKLEALEAGNYQDLPDMTFARALASSACRHLKIDPAPVLEQIPLGHSPVLGDSSHSINTPFRPAKESPTSPLADILKRPAILVTGALVLAAVALMYMPDLRPTADAISGAVSGLSSTADVPPAVVKEGATAMGSPQDATTVVSDVPVVLTPSLAVAAGDAAPTGAPPMAEAGVANVAEGLLILKATGDSWVEVVDGAGVSQVQRMLKTGDVLSFSVNPPYSVVLGRADTVEVSVRGQPFDVLPYARNSVARFQVK